MFAYKKLKESGQVDCMLVVAKLKIVELVWPNENAKWEGLGFSCGLLHGPKKDKVLEEEHDIYFINYEGLAWLKKKLIGRKRRMFDMVVYDESSKLKGHSKRFQIAKSLMIIPRRYILTGSPAPNGLEDLYRQIYILDGGASLGERIGMFRLKYFEPCGYMGYEWRIKPGMEQQIYKAIKHLVLRFDRSLLDLPPLIPNTIYVELSAEARRVYKSVEDDFIAELKSGENVLVGTAASVSSKLRQITGGHVYGEQREEHFIHADKLDALEELVEELQGSPLLVAYEFKHELKSLLKRFPKAKYIGGGVKSKEVAQIEKAWNKGELALLFGQPESVAHGLNLQGGPCVNVCYYTTSWNLENDEQFYQRVWRQGQKSAVTLHRLIMSDTVDEVVLKAINSKGKVQRGLLDALKDHYLKDSGGANVKNQRSFDVFLYFLKTNKIKIRRGTHPTNLIERVVDSICYQPTSVIEGMIYDVSSILETLDFEPKVVKKIVTEFVRKQIESESAVGNMTKLIKLYKEPEMTFANVEASEEQTSNFTKPKKPPTKKKKVATKTKAKSKRKEKPVSAQQMLNNAERRKKKAKSKKKVSAKKPLTNQAQLLKLIERKKGCAIQEATDRLGFAAANVRALVSALRIKGYKIEYTNSRYILS